MASNSFGQLFKITTWGESHGKAIGVVIDGCPAGLPLTDAEIHAELALRAPGNSPFTSPRQESDEGEILSGIFEGKTTGAPISFIIYNRNQDSSKYESIKYLLRPGHANFTYLEKYGIFDYRGGGRASARETACRVAAGAIAKKILRHFNIEIVAYIKQIGEVVAEHAFAAFQQSPLDNLPRTKLRNADPWDHDEFITKVMDEERYKGDASVMISEAGRRQQLLTVIQDLRSATYKDPVFCPDTHASSQMMASLAQAQVEGDSLGGIVEFVALNLPVGLGDPVYAKLDALLAAAMLSIPATKGFEIGSGFKAASMQGSAHNDSFVLTEGQIQTGTNFAGGTLGGISTGMPLVGRVAFKPTSSIKKEQETVNTAGEKSPFILPEGSRHDPCVAIRAVPVVEAMLAITLVDALLLHRCARL